MRLNGTTWFKFFFLSSTDACEVSSIIAGLRNAACGYDNIAAHTVKLLNDIASPILLHVVNAIFSTSVFPTKMKIAKGLAL